MEYANMLVYEEETGFYLCTAGPVRKCFRAVKRHRPAGRAQCPDVRQEHDWK